MLMPVVYLLIAVALVYSVMYFLRFNKQSKEITNYTPEQVAEKRKADTNIVILDVRTNMERKRNMIAGSIHIPLGDIDSRIAELNQYKSKEIICYCQGGVRSVSAASNLHGKGFHASNMLGGIAAWNAKNLK